MKISRIIAIVGLVLIGFGMSKMFSVDDASGSVYALVGVFFVSYVLRNQYVK